MSNSLQTTTTVELVGPLVLEEKSVLGEPVAVLLGCPLVAASVSIPQKIANTAVLAGQPAQQVNFAKRVLVSCHA